MDEQTRRSHGEPSCVTRLIRLPEVMNRVGLGRSTIYRWMAEERFPLPVQLGGHVVAWQECDINRWIEGRQIKSRLKSG